MELHIAYASTADKDVERATMHDDAEGARRLTRDIERGTRVIESWVLRSGGEMVTQNGTRGSFKVPAEHLDELLDIIRQYEEATQSKFACGVGGETAEAAIALKVAEKRGGDPAVVLYTPDVAQEAHDFDQDDDSFLTDEAEDDVLEDMDEPVAKAQFNDPAEAGEATKVAQGALSPTAALPSAPSPLTPGSPPAQDPAAQGQGQPPQQGQAGPQSPQELKQAIAGVLQDVKQQLPNIEQLKQTAPDAYQAILGMVEAMLALAQSKFGGDAAVQSPVQKAEGKGRNLWLDSEEGRSWTAAVEREMEEHPHLTREEAEKLVADHMRTEKAEPHPLHPYHALKPTATGRHELHLPTGTTHGRRVKVVHPDGKTTWVQVGAGQVMSEDGHPISSRNPGGR
jgi:hypothetical protein